MESANRSKSVFAPNRGRIIIAAASARALAASSLRARRPVSTIDLFADPDTKAICRESNRHLLSDQAPNFAIQCPSMEAVAKTVENLMKDPSVWGQVSPPTLLVGGGLENYLRTHRRGDILTEEKGIGGGETARVRHVYNFCKRNSILFPSITQKLNTHQTGQRALVKTDFSSGGLGVRFANKDSTLEDGQYFQNYVDGQSISACYLAPAKFEGAGLPRVMMLGVFEPIASASYEASASHVLSASHKRSEQDVEAPLPFRYGGSVGPVKVARLSAPVIDEFKRVGLLAADHFGLAGVFGIDFVLEQNKLWMLEINPRITASAELVEHAALQTMPDFSIVQLHLDAVVGDVEPESAALQACQEMTQDGRIFAKQVVYRHHAETQALKMSQTHLDAMVSHFDDFDRVPQSPPTLGKAVISDVPAPGTEIFAGHPVLTVHVSGETKAEAEQALSSSFVLLRGIFKERLS